jgi:soluble lytic murein transglycosylase-like protein
MRPVAWLILALTIVSPGVVHADMAPSQACGAAGAAAEKSANLPANLLTSIGIVESGRADPLTGAVAPWPWTVNVDGAGRYFDSKADAEAFVRLAQSSGAQDVDVGCFQISLLYHPDAFASLDQAFDPVANANYAAGFLSQLKAETGSWNTAIADYHSALPELGLPYQRRVLALEPAAFAEPDPVVILQSAAARSVRVITMDDPVAESGGGGMPRIITP